MLQRMCAGLAMGKELDVTIYSEEEASIAASLTFEIDLLKKNNTGKVCFPLDRLLPRSPSTSTLISSPS